MTQSAGSPSLPITGVRVTALIVIWLAVVYLAASPRLYYESLAALYIVPSLGLIYAYCLSHRSRTSAVLAVVATVVAVLIIGFAIVIPKGSAA